MAILRKSCGDYARYSPRGQMIFTAGPAGIKPSIRRKRPKGIERAKGLCPSRRQAVSPAFRAFGLSFQGPLI